ADVIHPEGYRFQTGFRLDPYPVFTYQAGGVDIEKTLCMVQGENTTVIRYQIRSDRRALLEIRPLVAFRDYHALTHENPDLNPAFESDKTCIRIQPYVGLPSLYLTHNAARIENAGVWYRSFEYPAERDRGLDFQEDLFNPFVMVYDGAEAVVIASTDRHDPVKAAEYLAAEGARRQRGDSTRVALERAANQ